MLAPAWRAFSSQCSGTEGHAGYYRKGSGGDQADTRQHAENGFVLGHPFDGSPDPVEHDRRRSDCRKHAAKILKDRPGLYCEGILPRCEVWKDYESISLQKQHENNGTEYGKGAEPTTIE